MRLAALIVVVLLAAAATVIAGGEQPQPDPLLGTELPAMAVCPVQEGAGRSTRLMVLSTVDGPARLSSFAGGEETAHVDLVTGPEGLVAVDMVDVAAVGTVGSLVELPMLESAVGTLVTGPESVAAESCLSTPRQEFFITGGSTASEEEFELHLMNPYSGEAIVDMVVRSEVGIEATAALSSLVVPPRTSHVVDFTRVLPGREEISITIAVQKGAIFGAGRQRSDGASAMWNAVAAGQNNWHVPIPAGEGRTLLIGNPSGIEVDFQIDHFGPEGLEDALQGGIIEPRGRVEIDLDEISIEAGAIRVVATGPVVPVLTSRPGLAYTTGSDQVATLWLIPAARLEGVEAPEEDGEVPEEEEEAGDEENGEEGGEAEAQEGVATRARLVILNPEIDDVVVSYRPLGMAEVNEVELGAEDVVEILVDPADGYLVESTGPIVVLWVIERQGAAAFSIGVPLPDG